MLSEAAEILMVKTKIQDQRDRGAVAVISAILIGFGIALPATALVMDVGSIYVESQELTSGADAAALSVAQECIAGNCTAADLATQLAVAETQADVNAKDGQTAVTEVCGSWAGLPACTTQSQLKRSTCIGDAPTGNYVEVRVETETDSGSTLLPPIFARTFVGNETYSGTNVRACARVAEADVCVSADEATYTHTFSPITDKTTATATITPDRALCPGQTQSFTLVSYTAPAATYATPQYMYDYETKTMDSSTETLTFTVDVPGCYNQVDFVFGSQVVNPLTYSAYGNTKIGSSNEPGSRSIGVDAWYNGGTKKCDSKATVTSSVQSDKSLKLTLTSKTGATNDAVFTVKTSSDSTVYRVTKGTSTKANSQTVTISAADYAAGVQVQDNIVDSCNQFCWVTFKK